MGKRNAAPPSTAAIMIFSWPELSFPLLVPGKVGMLIKGLVVVMVRDLVVDVGVVDVGAAGALKEVDKM